MSALNSLALVLLLTAWLMVITRDLAALVQFSALQGLLLGLVAALLGWSTGEPHLYLPALLTVLIKGLAVPTVLRRILYRIGPVRLRDAVFTTRTMAVVAFALTGAGYRMAAPLVTSAGRHVQADHLLPVALSLVLVGTFLVISRRVALSQALGLLVVENGLFLAALGIAGGVPLVMDAGILLELVVAVLIIGALVQRMQGLVGSISTEQFRRLKG